MDDCSRGREDGGRREEGERLGEGKHECSHIYVHVCDSLGLGNTSVALQYTNIQDMLIYSISVVGHNCHCGKQKVIILAHNE